jgi:hypothetical protein
MVSCALVAEASSTTWHRRLRHPGHEALSKLASTSAIGCNKIVIKLLVTPSAMHVKLVGTLDSLLQTPLRELSRILI